MKPLSFLLLLFLFSQNIVYGQTGLEGHVLDERGIPLQDANVLVKNSTNGTSTNLEGYFFIELENGNYTVLISLLGYKTQTISISIDGGVEDLQEIHLVSTPQIMDEVVISGSRTLEKITESPASINLIDGDQFENFTGSPEELFAVQKGVDFARIGNFLGSMSIRGFNSTFNQKLLLLDDNRIANLRIRTPVGPMSAFVKEDIERVEIVLGPSSALYGPNCLNGLFYTLSKSPFEYPGTDVVLGVGSNDLINMRMRHARKINNKWAYKITFENLSGVEEDFTDSVYNPTAAPGKAEVGLDRNVLFLKGLAAAFYKPTEKSEIGINYAFNKNNSVTIGARNNAIDWLNSSLQVTYKSPRWYAQFYKTWIKVGQGVNTQVRTSNYHDLLAVDQSEEEAFHNSMDGPRPATFEEDSYRLNGEIQYNNNWGNLSMVAGTQYQREIISSNNTIYIEEPPIRLNLIGVYGQVMYTFGNTGLKILATARGDDHSLYGFNFLPKTGITFTKSKSTWRLTYGGGYATPTLVNAYVKTSGAARAALGNSDGFTLSDGTNVVPIMPEKIKTLEVGYKSVFYNRRLFLDMEAYYNWQENLISPQINVVQPGASQGTVVTHRGDRPIEDFGVASGTPVFSYINYGRVNTYGIDIGLNYYFSDRYNLTFNYSFFDYSIDSTDPNNDVNKDGRVDNFDIAINTPRNKISSAFNGRFNKFYSSVFARWVQKYDFFSGPSVAAATNPNNIYSNYPVVQDQRVGAKWNYGPLGGFYLSINGNYQITDILNVGIFVNNILGEGNYEFVAAPPTETTFGIELKVSL